MSDLFKFLIDNQVDLKPYLKCDQCKSWFDSGKKVIEKLKQENKKLKDCVQWYYENEIVSFDRYTEVSSCGQFTYATNLKANETLKEIEEQNEKNYN